MKSKLFFILLFISSLAFAQFPTNGLIGEYSFTGGSLVDGANGNNFTQTGVALTTLDDRFLSITDAINLGGDHLTRTNINYPNSGINSDLGSVSFWIKTTTNSSDIKTIIDDTRDRNNQADNTWSGYYIYLRDGKVGVSVRVKYNGFYSFQGFGNLSSQVISDGNWHHVAITMDNRSQSSATGATTIVSASVKLYVDGVIDGNSGVAKSSAASIYLLETNDQNGNITIANNKTNNLPTQNRYQDTIDDLLFYGRRLSDAEVASIANYNFCFDIDSSTITVSNKTATSFDVAWQEDGDFELAYVLSGQAIANASVITVNGYTSGNTQNISGLTEGTFYDIYIREKCTAITYAAWSNVKTVRTLGKIYVKANASGTNDGSSWIDAYTDIQDALTIAENDQEIWIAEGVYNPNASDRNVSFVFDKPNMLIYGGFAGTETQLADRDLTANHTSILSGDLNNNDTGVDFSGNNRSDNSNTIIKANGENLLFDGLTISDGQARTGDKIGAGILKSTLVNVLTIKNCVFKNNVALNSGAGLNAKIDATSSSTITIESSIFKDNVARFGTSIYANNTRHRTLIVNISNSLFNGNIAKNNGSGLGYAGSAGWFRATASAGNSTTNVYLTNNTYVNNSDTGTEASLNNFTRATVGITKIGSNSNTGTVANCIFWNNTTAGNVTAKAIGPIHKDLGNVTVNNSIDENNFSLISNTNHTTNLDPLFTNAGSNDYTLQSNSPAINLGDNSYLPNTIVTDLIGNDRISITVVDAGAYEYQCASCFGIVTNVVGNGTISQSGGAYNSGDVATLTANPAVGYHFVAWSGDITGTINPESITMNANKNVTATFEKSPIYIDVDATGANDGTSWSDAYTSLRTAILNISTPNETLWIAEGMYYPTASNTRADSFLIDDDNTSIYGGFVGIETALEDRDLTANHSTILSGDYMNDDIGAISFTGNNRDNNSYNIIKAYANDIIIDGVTISDGQANDVAASDGSAIIKLESKINLTVRNCTLKFNAARGGGTIRAWFDSDGFLTVENCIFDRNLARYATGIYSGTRSNVTITSTVANSLFTNNLAMDFNNSQRGFAGSALWFRANGTNSFFNTEINNCTFARNQDYGTAGSIDNTERATLGLTESTANNGSLTANISNCIFWDNLITGNTIANAVGPINSTLGTINVYNAIDENSFSILVAGNLTNTSNSNPLFVNAVGNDFTLQSGSPAIDSGDNAKIPANIQADLLGNFRIHNVIVDLGCYEYGASVLGVDEFEEILDFTVYPNPAKDVLNIKMDDNLEQAIIYNIQGQKVLVSLTEQINISRLSSGFYIIKIKTEYGKIATKRFMKR
jgi:hypothetical protein